MFICLIIQEINEKQLVTMVLCMLTLDICILSLWHITDTITWEPVLSEIEVIDCMYYYSCMLIYIDIKHVHAMLLYTFERSRCSLVLISSLYILSTKLTYLLVPLILFTALVKYLFRITGWPWRRWNLVTAGRVYLFLELWVLLVRRYIFSERCVLIIMIIVTIGQTCFLVIYTIPIDISKCWI